MLITTCMNNPQSVLSEHNDNTTSTEIDTTVSEIDTLYSYIFIPRTYTKNKDGTYNRIEPHWEIYDTLYEALSVDPCGGYDDSEADLIFYIYSHETKTYSRFYHIPEHGIYPLLKNIIKKDTLITSDTVQYNDCMPEYWYNDTL
jgi:hypothetical protein